MIWATVRRAFDCFADPKVLESLGRSTTPSTQCVLGRQWDHRSDGFTGGPAVLRPIVAALIEDIVHTARRQAAESESHRLDAGLMLMLDECANIAPLGDLPKLVAELADWGSPTTVILQSVAAARNIWGEAGERALRDLANITRVWGGQKDSAFLEEISRLAGEDDQQVETISIGPSGKVSSWSTAVCRSSRTNRHLVPGPCSHRVPLPPAPDYPLCDPGARSRSCPIRSNRAERCRPGSIVSEAMTDHVGAT